MKRKIRSGLKETEDGDGPIEQSHKDSSQKADYRELSPSKVERPQESLTNRNRSIGSSYGRIFLYNSATATNHEPSFNQRFAAAHVSAATAGFVAIFFTHTQAMGLTDRITCVQYQKLARRAPNFLRMIL
jgi:hypothetical protein